MISNERIKNKLLKMAFNGDLLGIKEKVESDIGYYAIPNNWEWKKLGEIVNIVNGFTPLRTEKSFWDKPEISWFTIDDMRRQGYFINQTEQYITNKALGNSSNRLLPPNTTLLCCTASVGEVAYTNIPLTTNQQFNGLIVKDSFKDVINPLYIFEYAKTLKDILIDKAGKTTINFVSTKKLSEILIPIPTITEQNTIVDKLESAFELIDKKEKNDQDKEKYIAVLKEKILDSAIHGLLIENDTTLNNPMVEEVKNDIPFEIPYNWKWTFIKCIGDVIGGGTPKTGEPSYWNGNVNWVTPADMKSDNKFITSGKNSITEKGLSESSARLMPKGTIVISSRAPIGYVKIATDDISTSQGCKSIVVNNESVFNEYVYYYIKAIPKYLNSIGTGTTFREISGKTLGNVMIPIPPLEEQKRIVEKIESLFELIEQL